MTNPLSFLIGRPTRVRFSDSNITTGSQDLMLVDATINEVITREAEVTDNPVEEGLDVSDHYRPLPKKYQIDGYVSDAPITFLDDLNSLTTAASSIITAPLGGFGSGLATVVGAKVGASLLKSSGSPADVAVKALEDMMDSKRIFTIVTKRGRLESMVLTQLSFPRDGQTGQGVAFSAQCKQVRIVKAASVLIPNIKRDVAHSAAPPAKLGTQGAATPTDQNSKKSSILYKLLKGA